MKKLIAATAAGLMLVAGQAVAVDNGTTAGVVDRVSMAGAQGYGEGEGGLPMWGVVALSLGVIILGVSLLDDSDSQ